MRCVWVMLVLTSMVVAGCESGGESGAPSASPSTETPQAAAGPPAPPPPIAGNAGKAAREADEPATEAADEAASEPAHKSQDSPKRSSRSVREAAKVGVGARGRDLGTGILETPVNAYFRSQDRLSFMQIEQAMNLYHAEHGYFPKTQEEFMKEIIIANHLGLPKLPTGHRYVYDAKKAASQSQYDGDDPPLLVEHPR